jgi:hypothetical protein
MSLEAERMSFIEAVMMEGCPHCGDGVPKIVHFYHRKSGEHTHFVGDWNEAEKVACQLLGELRIVSCRAIDEKEFLEGPRDDS